MATRLYALRYIAVLALCFMLAIVASWWQPSLANRINNQAYDYFTTPYPNPHSEAVIVAIDEATLRETGEMQNIRPTLAATLLKIQAGHPAAVALDITFGGASRNADDDQKLAHAFHATPNLILNCAVDRDGRWEDPLPLFAEAAAAIGHAHLARDAVDGVTRQLPIGQIHARESRWALALEAFRVAHKLSITDSTVDTDPVDLGPFSIPAPRVDGERSMYIRYTQPGGIPEISARTLDQHLKELQGKTVFLGITAESAAYDRLKIPTGETLVGVEVHAQAYETLRRGDFFSTASNESIVAVSLLLAIAVGAVFWFLHGWISYAAVFPLLGFTLYLPKLFLERDVVFPLVEPAMVLLVCMAGAAAFQYLTIRGTLRQTESEKARYQQAIHWAAHEMRTPLTAIQGSSELMTRYALPEEKRGQLSEMINSESKRLSRIIQTFLDIERFTEGNAELKKETFPAAEIVEVCLRRVTPLGERKNIQITLDTPVHGTLTGDRELMEYAFYNLLTNAVKYSPADTHVRIRAEHAGGKLRLSVEDQGIGMDAKELKNIFKKFYRTKRAEASGEVGTGIGLSIVEQIVVHHGGRIDVTSTPGKGSCFTMILTAQ